ncbi:Imm51 family immunity protein [Actinoplanes sp. HUAS TT8]|uniref:Imm51 family immunity protein n=1 Tax=Actinoplanes sp. HUAS TT8 TaxID=3447453 RepID=UPI003F5205EB
MNDITVEEIDPGRFRLYLVTGTSVDAVIGEFGHEPNGPFWEGITELLVATEAPALEGRFWADSESDAFLAHSEDRRVLDDLATRLGAAMTDEARLRELMTIAQGRGFRFDD